MAKMPPPSIAKSAFQDGLDSMWKFQLRKENAVLLENQEAQQKILQVLAAESTKAKKDFEERYSALEARLTYLEDDERKDRHAFETWREEMAVLKSQMDVVTEKQERQISEAQATGSKIDRTSPRMSTTHSIDVPASSSRTAIATTTPSTRQSASANNSKSNLAGLMRAPVTSFQLHASNENASTSSELTGPMTRSRSRSRSTSLPLEPAPTRTVQDQTTTPAPLPKAKVPAAAPLPPGQTIQIPRLHQGHKSLKTYLDKATTTWLSLSDSKDQKLEIQFIALFINGIGDERKREALVGELQQQHQSRTKKDGKVEILCKWKDVGQGMKEAGLISMGNTSRSAGPKEKAGNKRKTDRLLKELQSSDGFLRL